MLVPAIDVIFDFDLFVFSAIILATDLIPVTLSRIYNPKVV